MTNTTISNKFMYAIAASMTALFGVFMWFFVVPHALAAEEGSDEHLVTIHDRGKEKSVISKKDTLREILDDANIVLDKNDIVEPGLDQKLVAESYQVNIYRARPVVIADGTHKVLIMSAYQTPKSVAKHGGFELQDEDNVSVKVSDNFVRDGASEVVYIDRATAINLVLYGQPKKVFTQMTTVDEFLKEKEIQLGENDSISVAETEKISEGMTIQVWRNGKQTITVDEEIKFETEQIQDANQPIGYSKVQTPGKLGKKTVTYEIEMKNGQEISRKEIQSVEIDKPSKQVEVVGANTANLGGTCSEWIAGAGITDVANAVYLINKESGCNPYAVNKSSGACGVGQALPCSKTGCAMGDGACQTIWMNSYVLGRYGSWAAAVQHSKTYGWY